jgi:hypothetical protein
MVFNLSGGSVHEALDDYAWNELILKHKGCSLWIVKMQCWICLRTSLQSWCEYRRSSRGPGERAHHDDLCYYETFALFKRSDNYEFSFLSKNPLLISVALFVVGNLQRPFGVVPYKAGFLSMSKNLHSLMSNSNLPLGLIGYPSTIIKSH